MTAWTNRKPCSSASVEEQGFLFAFRLKERGVFILF